MVVVMVMESIRKNVCIKQKEAVVDDINLISHQI